MATNVLDLRGLLYGSCWSKEAFEAGKRREQGRHSSYLSSVHIKFHGTAMTVELEHRERGT